MTNFKVKPEEMPEDVWKQVQRLDSSNLTEKHMGVLMLLRKSHPASREALEKALEDKDSTTRFIAAAALGRIADPKSIEPLQKTLEKDEDAEVKLYVKKALEKIKNNQT
jgi:HEAT repeat protein